MQNIASFEVGRRISSETPLMSLGVLGGIGPESTGEFYRELIRLFQEEFRPRSNEEFPRILINSIPARELIDVSSGNVDGVSEYHDGLLDLERWTADVAIMACNSAYCFYDIITRDISIPVINARETVERALQRLQCKETLVLASPTTLRNGLYVFEGVRAYALSERETQMLGRVIERYNLGQHSAADLECLRSLARDAIAKGAMVIAGCTEIHAILGDVVPHLNPMTEMAREMIRIWVEMKKWKKIPSIIHGTGISSRVAIEKGKIAYQIAFAKKSNTFQKHWAYIDGVWYSDGGAFDWLNHSCDPNVEIIVHEGRPSLRAIRDIAPNEEIVCDYEATEGTEGKAMQCHCGSEKCRGVFHIKL